jgi:Ras-related protein Rab-1A
MSNPEVDDSKTVTYKMILLGDTSVGKTCLFKKLTTGVYSNKNVSTIGIDKKTININGSKIVENEEEKDLNFSIQLYDTAGQERFRAISKTYYTGSHGLIVMYDITKKETFNNVEDWIKGIRETLGETDENKKYVIILMGNKKDLEEKREVQVEEAEELCQKNNVFFGGECSVQDFTQDELMEKFQIFIKNVFQKIGIVYARKATIISSKSTKKERQRCC